MDGLFVLYFREVPRAVTPAIRLGRDRHRDCRSRAACGSGTQSTQSTVLHDPTLYRIAFPLNQRRVCGFRPARFVLHLTLYVACHVVCCVLHCMTAVRPQAKVIRREFAAHFCLGLVARVQGGDACVRTTRPHTFTTAQSRSRTRTHTCTRSPARAHARKDAHTRTRLTLAVSERDRLPHMGWIVRISRCAAVKRTLSRRRGCNSRCASYQVATYSTAVWYAYKHTDWWPASMPGTNKQTCARTVNRCNTLRQWQAMPSMRVQQRLPLLHSHG